MGHHCACLMQFSVSETHSHPAPLARALSISLSPPAGSCTPQQACRKSVFVFFIWTHYYTYYIYCDIYVYYILLACFLAHCSAAAVPLFIVRSSLLRRTPCRLPTEVGSNTRMWGYGRDGEGMEGRIGKGACQSAHGCSTMPELDRFQGMCKQRQP